MERDLRVNCIRIVKPRKFQYFICLIRYTICIFRFGDKTRELKDRHCSPEFYLYLRMYL